MRNLMQCTPKMMKFGRTYDRIPPPKHNLASGRSGMTEQQATRKRKYTRLKPSAWAEIEALWQAGEVTLAELSDRFGVSPRAIQTHAKKHGIIRGEKTAALAAAVREEVLKEELDDKDILVKRA